MKRINACIAIVLAMMIISCNKASNSNDATTANVVQEIQLEDGKLEEKNKMIATDTVAVASAPPNVLQSGSPANPDWDKKIIKTADVRLELKDYGKYNTTIHANLKNFGAYIASEEQNQNEDGIENRLSIKVPVDKFEELMNTFSGDDIKVIQKKISTEDVTGEVVDTKGRIEAKKAAREKYLEFLKGAKNMKDMLEVQNEINSLQEDLESASSRVNYLVHQASYSTINLSYYQFNGTRTYSGEPGFFSKLQEAFKNGSSIVSGSLLFLVTIWPLLLVSVFVWFLIKRSKYVFVKASKKM